MGSSDPQELLALRLAEQEGRAEAARDSFLAQEAEGVGLLVDIGNQLDCCRLVDGEYIEHQFLLELLGLSLKAGEQGRATMSDIANRYGLAVTGHAPHTTSASLLKEIGARSAMLSSLLSIHVAESAAELELLQSGQGPFRE